MKNTPYNVMRHSSWDFAPRDPVSIGTAIITAFGGSAALAGTTIAFGITVAGVVGYAAVTLVTSWAMRALAPKPSFGSLGSQGILVNARDPAAPHQFVYGQIRKGGTVTYLETTGETNEYLHMIIALAGHPVEEIGDIYIDDQIVTWDQTSGNVTDAFLDGDDNPTIRIRKFDGTQTAAPSELLEESELTGDDALTSAFVGHEIAYLYIRLKYDQSAYPNGMPLFTAVVKGKKVFDPRTSTTAWSDNAALCIRDYLTSAYGLSDSNVDDTAFSAAANISYENVATDAGGTVKRYTMNGIITADINHGDVLSQMVTACAGTLFWGTGKWKLTVADYIAPTKTLTLDDLRSSISVQTRTNLRDQFNIVQGKFINKDERWITQDYPPIIGNGFIAQDGNVEQPLDFELPFTTDSATAQRLAKLTLFRGREQMVISAEFGLNAFDVEVGEIINLTLDRYGWTNKEFEVLGWQLKANDDAGDLRVALTLRETSEAAFDWNAEESDIIGNDTNLPDPFGGLTINNLTASGGGRTQGDGTFINSAILNWDDASNAFVDYYEVEWKVKTDSIYSSTTTEQSGIEIVPVVDGLLYEFRVRAVTVAGVKGEYATVEFTGGGDQTAPGLPTNITATGGFQYITISWTNPIDADLNYVEIWEADVNNSGAATRVGISGGNNFQRTSLGLEVTKWYFLKSVDYSGNVSGFTSGVSATTTFIDDEDFANGIYSLFTEQGLYAIEDVTSLPPSGDFTGQKVYNRADGKLYSWTGTEWETAVFDGVTNFSELEGLLQANQIAVDAVTNAAIANNAVQAENIAALAVTADKVANNAITTAKIADDAITTGKLAANAVDATVLADLAVNEAKIQDNAITTAKIAAAAVTAGELASNAVTSIKIANDAITETKISDDAITTPKIAAGAITASEIAAFAVTADKIAADSIDASKIAAGSITGNEIAANTLTATNIAAGTITASEIATSAVTADKIAANAVTAAKVEAGAITAGKIAAGAVTAGTIAANAVTTTTIAADAITTAKIAAGNITATELATNSVTSTKIAASAVTADKIAANSITSAKIAAGTITASDIAAATITGDKIAASTITGNKITANTITGGLIAASGIITNSAQINDAVIVNAKIQNAAVDTLKIAGNSATVARFAGPNTGSAFGPPQYTTLASLSWTPSYSGQALVEAASRLELTSPSDENPEWELQLTVNNVLVDTSGLVFFDRARLFNGYVVELTAGVPVSLVLRFRAQQYVNFVGWSGAWLAALERYR